MLGVVVTIMRASLPVWPHPRDGPRAGPTNRRRRCLNPRRWEWLPVWYQSSDLRQFQLAQRTPTGLARRHARPELLVQPEPAAVEVGWLIGCNQLGQGPPGIL